MHEKVATSPGESNGNNDLATFEQSKEAFIEPCVDKILSEIKVYWRLDGHIRLDTLCDDYHIPEYAVNVFNSQCYRQALLDTIVHRLHDAGFECRVTCKTKDKGLVLAYTTRVLENSSIIQKWFALCATLPWTLLAVLVLFSYFAWDIWVGSELDGWLARP